MNQEFKITSSNVEFHKNVLDELKGMIELYRLERGDVRRDLDYLLKSNEDKLSITEFRKY